MFADFKLPYTSGAEPLDSLQLFLTFVERWNARDAESDCEIVELASTIVAFFAQLACRTWFYLPKNQTCFTATQLETMRSYIGWIGLVSVSLDLREVRYCAKKVMQTPSGRLALPVDLVAGIVYDSADGCGAFRSNFSLSKVCELVKPLSPRLRHAFLSYVLEL